MEITFYSHTVKQQCALYVGPSGKRCVDINTVNFLFVSLSEAINKYIYAVTQAIFHVILIHFLGYLLDSVENKSAVHHMCRCTILA